MAKKTKTAALTIVPQTRHEAVEAIRKIGELQTKIEGLKAVKDNAVRDLGKELEVMLTPLNEQIEELQNGVQVYCEAHRGELTQNNKVKYHDFGTGRINWRVRPPSVAVRNVAVVLELCKSRELNSFIRVKEEINKDAMLAEPELAATIAGVTIKSAGEDFVIEPVGLQTSQKGAA